MANENKVIPQATDEEIVGKTTLEGVAEEETVEGENVENAQKPAENRCVNCQALIERGQAFCPECGACQIRLCQNCKTELQEGQAFCPSCGQKIGGESLTSLSAIEQFNQSIVNKSNKANKRKKVFLVIGIAVLLIGIAAYFIFQSLKVAEYKENARDFYSTVLSAAVNLEDIGNEVEDEWYDYIYDRWSKYDSVDEAVEGALSNMSVEVRKAKRQKTVIDELYEKLKKPVNNSVEIEELCKAVKTLYDEYKDLYDCVTDPSGNYRTFNSHFESCDSETADACKELKELCDDLE